MNSKQKSAISLEGSAFGAKIYAYSPMAKSNGAADMELLSAHGYDSVLSINGTGDGFNNCTFELKNGDSNKVKIVTEYAWSIVRVKCTNAHIEVCVPSVKQSLLRLAHNNLLRLFGKSPSTY